MPQIHLWSGERELYLSHHDFYVKQVKKRILRSFDNMNEEADRMVEEVYARIGSMPSYEGERDMSDVAEHAEEQGIEFYLMLSDLQVQTTLAALASLYHQWEKDFRGFMERELSHTYDPVQVEKHCWQDNIGWLFEVLEECGWTLREAPWFPKIDACRLIINVHKHGKGNSLRKLTKYYPQYLKGSFDDFTKAPWFFSNEGKAILGSSGPSHKHLSVTEGEFDQIARAFREFWVKFPERLYLPAS